MLVVSRPQKAHQSLTTIPAPITSLPRFTVPAWREEGREREKEGEGERKEEGGNKGGGGGVGVIHSG